MKRGEVWTVSGGSEYTGKPRPAVILQDDRFDATASVTLCAFTTVEIDAPLLRLPVEPSAINGLREASQLMIDKVVTVPRTRLRARLGCLDDEDSLRLNRALIVFLGLAASPASRTH